MDSPRPHAVVTLSHTHGTEDLRRALQAMPAYTPEQAERAAAAFRRGLWRAGNSGHGKTTAGLASLLRAHLDAAPPKRPLSVVLAAALLGVQPSAVSELPCS